MLTCLERKRRGHRVEELAGGDGRGSHLGREADGDGLAELRVARLNGHARVCLQEHLNVAEVRRRPHDANNLAVLLHIIAN